MHIVRIRCPNVFFPLPFSDKYEIVSFRSIYKTRPKKHCWGAFYVPGTIWRPRKRKATKRLSLWSRSLLWGARHPLTSPCMKIHFICSTAPSFPWLLLNCHVVNPSTAGSLVIYELSIFSSTPAPPQLTSKGTGPNQQPLSQISARGKWLLAEPVPVPMNPLGQISSLNTVFITGAWNTNLQMPFPLACCWEPAQ